MTDTQLEQVFDFSIVPAQNLQRAIELDGKLGEAVRKLNYTVDEIGEICIEMKSILPHGYFEDWYDRKGLSQNQASYAMRKVRGRNKNALGMLDAMNTTIVDGTIEKNEIQSFEKPMLSEKAQSIVDAPVFTRDAMNNEFKRGMEQQRKLDEIELREQETRHNQDVQKARHQRVESLQRKIENLEADKKELQTEKKRLETLTPTKPNQQEIADAEHKIQTLQTELSLLERQYKSQTGNVLKTAIEKAIRDALRHWSDPQNFDQDDWQEVTDIEALLNSAISAFMHKHQPSEIHQSKDLDLDLSHI
jgi:DNA repair exonuclease SbcCD ATPase subunit